MLQKLRSLLAPTSTALQDGVWRSNTYGLLFSVQNSRVNVFQTSSKSCFALHTFSGRLCQNQRATPLGPMRLEQQGSELVVYFGMAEDPIVAVPAAIENHCRTNPDQLSGTVYNFDVFWQTFRDHYPFFPLYGVDW